MYTPRWLGVTPASSSRVPGFSRGRARPGWAKARPPTAAGKTSDFEKNDPSRGLIENDGGHVPSWSSVGVRSSCDSPRVRCLHARVRA